VRDLVSPAMRSAGLRGSAGPYYMPSLSCFALVGFQKSTWSTGSAVNFTMNLKVVSREVWSTGIAQLVQAPVRPARRRPGRCDGQQNPSLRRQCPQMLIVVQHGHPVLFPDSTESG
jgi:Domain of unknown function (DUF4304)